MPRAPHHPTDPRTLRVKVREAIAFLEEDGHPEHAAYLGEFLEQKTSRDWAAKPTVPMWMSAAAAGRADVRAKAEGKTRAAVVEEGLEALLAGQWAPRKPPRRAHGVSDAKTVSVRIAPELQARVAAFVEAHADEWDWAPSPNQVAAAWLEQEYAPAPAE